MGFFFKMIGYLKKSTKIKIKYKSLIVFLEPTLDCFYYIIDLRVVLNIITEDFQGFLKLIHGSLAGNDHLEQSHSATLQSIFILGFSIKAFQNVKRFNRIIKMTYYY